MADIELVIKIDEETYKKCKWKNNGVVGLEWWERAIAKGTPLPKGHGRLIDMKMLIKFVTDYCEYDAVQLIRADRTDYLPTIIEADKAESEGKE